MQQTVIKLNENKQLIEKTEGDFSETVLKKKLVQLEEENCAQKNLIADYERSASTFQQKAKQLMLEKTDLQSNLELLQDQYTALQENYSQLQTELQLQQHSQAQSIGSISNDTTFSLPKQHSQKYHI